MASSGFVLAAILGVVMLGRDESDDEVADGFGMSGYEVDRRPNLRTNAANQHVHASASAPKPVASGVVSGDGHDLGFGGPGTTSGGGSSRGVFDVIVPEGFEAFERIEGDMNTRNLMSLSFFIRDQAKLHPSEPVFANKYVAAMILFACMSKDNGFGLRMYFDKFSLERARTIKAPPINIGIQWVAPQSMSDPDLFPHAAQWRNDVAEMHKRCIPRVCATQAAWDRCVQSGMDLGSALCVGLWTAMSADPRADYRSTWYSSAQLITVDLTPIAPWMYMQDPSTGRVRLKDSSYAASVFRIFSSRQASDFRFETSKGVVVYPPPQSVHIRDAHGGGPSRYDTDRVMAWVKDMSRKPYEVSFPPSSYAPEWVQLKGESLHFNAAIFNYINLAWRPTNRGAAGHGDRCIMPIEDFKETFGLLWDRDFSTLLVQRRRHRDDHQADIIDRGVGGETVGHYYGIDEILMRKFMGGCPSPIEPAVPRDPAIAAWNSSPRWNEDISPHVTEQVRQQLAGNPLFQQLFKPTPRTAKIQFLAPRWCHLRSALQRVLGGQDAGDEIIRAMVPSEVMYTPFRHSQGMTYRPVPCRRTVSLTFSCKRPTMQRGGSDDTLYRCVRSVAGGDHDIEALINLAPEADMSDEALVQAFQRVLREDDLTAANALAGMPPTILPAHLRAEITDLRAKSMRCDLRS